MRAVVGMGVRYTGGLLSPEQTPVHPCMHACHDAYPWFHSVMVPE